MDYVIVIHPAEEGGYWAEVPVLPGCYVQGETLDELLAEAPEVIESHLEALREDGKETPAEEQFVLATVRVPSPSAA
jgi:predicted RNase H-like HicB family nuclease